MNTVYCSEMWRHANGYNRHYRIKVLLNVDEENSSTSYSVKAQ